MKLRALALALSLGSFACGPGTMNPPPPQDSGVADGDASTRADAPPSVRGLPTRDCTAYFTYPLGRQAGSVSVAGSWNAFSQTADPMIDGLYTNVYRAALSLAPGSYAYKFVADGNWSLDPTHPLTQSEGSVENSRLVVADCSLPELRVERFDVSRERDITVVFQYVDGAARAGLDPSSLSLTINRAAAPDARIETASETAQITVRYRAPRDDKYTLRLTARDRMGHASAPRFVPLWVEPEPFQWSDGAMYFTFTDRFRNGDPSNDAPIAMVERPANYQGGDLAGVLAALREGYFDRLGVRSIWLSPVNANTNAAGRGSDGRMYSAYHGYWPTEPRTVDEHFGTLATLRELTAEAHRRGIRVLLDAVHNQLHREHPYFRMHPEWFNGNGSCVCGGPGCGWDDHPLECWFTDYLPDVNWQNPAAADQMLEDALFWLTEADIDGFRVDAVKHMPHTSVGYLRRRLREELETGNATYYLVGETFTGAEGRGLIQSYINPNELYGQFDFPLFWAVDYAFAQSAGTMGDLDASVRAGESTYRGAVMSPFLGNHDVARFLSRAAGVLESNAIEQGWLRPPAAPERDEPYERLFLAFTFVLTQPGVPLIYYGDEIGLSGAADPDNRRMMRFNEALSPRERTLFDRVSAVAYARGHHPGLRRGGRLTVHTDGDGYVYARGGGDALALVAINRGSTARSVRVTLPAELANRGRTLVDQLGSSATVAVGADGTCDIPFTPRGAAIFVARRAM